MPSTIQGEEVARETLNQPGCCQSIQWRGPDFSQPLAATVNREVMWHQLDVVGAELPALGYPKQVMLSLV